jgi:hypothetical protein
MILIEPNRPGSLWLKAMFRYYCRKYDCGVVWYPGGTCEATGANKMKAHYAYEMSHGQLMVRIINAIANSDKVNNSHTSYVTIRSYVKDLYKQGGG